MCDCLHLTINQGKIKGRTGVDFNGKGYHSFLGIPYARPPIGKLRFKAPEPAGKWNGVRDATQECSECYHRDIFTRDLVGSEDCLFLNVYIPEVPKTGTQLKSVMVWIHGGAFISGSNRSDMFGPEFLMTGDIILVTINYRLGVLGFLQLEDPKLGVTGNAGFKDMVMALKWVKANISSFGGDPQNVTIFGGSAGGAAVHFLMLSPMAKGLFHKAIAQSGSALNPWSMGSSPAKQLAQVLKCTHIDDEQNVLQFLQKIPVEHILEGQEQLDDEHSAHFIRPVGLVVETASSPGPVFLSEDPLNIIWQSDYHDVPLMMGYNSEEGLLFLAIQNAFNRSKMIEDFEDMVPNTFKLQKGTELSKSIAERIRIFYCGNKYAMVENKENACRLQMDNFFLWGIYESVRYHATLSTKPVYLYRFSVDAGLNFNKIIARIDLPGACHADELGYLFKTFNTPENLDPNGIEVRTVRRMVKLWTNFAKTGNPNPIEEVVWKPVGKDAMNYLDIGTKLKCGLNPERARMEFWDQIKSSVEISNTIDDSDITLQ